MSSVFTVTQSDRRRLIGCPLPCSVATSVLLFAIGVMTQWLCGSSLVASPPGRPNILLILTDDQGWPTLGCYGGKIVPTPHLDRLAEQGARFTDAYVTSQCTPTRASLLTGQYTARHGLWHVLSWYGYPRARMTEPMFLENYSRQTFTLAKGLRLAGYATAIFGKWHLTSNQDGNYRGLHPEAAGEYGFDFAPPLLSDRHFQPGADRGVSQLTDQTLAFIEKHRDRPWFCFLSHHMIHGVVVAPDALTQKYRDRGYGDVGPNRAVYLAGLECIDRSVGRVMDRLDRLGIADDTLVIFMSDNGGIDEKLDFKSVASPNPESPIFPVEVREYDNAPLRAGKGSIYEGGVRVPMIVRWPGRIKPGTVVRAPVHVIDVLPTCFEVAGATAPRDHPLDGRSLMPLLSDQGDMDFAQRPLFQYYPFYDLRWGLTPSVSIRVGKYKLIEFFGDRVDDGHRYRPGYRAELYDLRADPGEQQDLSSEQPQRVAKLRQQVRDWMDQVGCEVPQKNPHFDQSTAMEETRQKPEWLQDVRWRRPMP
ncbi:sulfatase [Roseiconus nitratireducens]|nr:sulfatase [Roseiconus nitratireducens]